MSVYEKQTNIENLVDVFEEAISLLFLIQLSGALVQ